MEPINGNSILEHPPNIKASIRKLYGLDNPKVLNESIHSLQNWVNKQNHFLKKDFDIKLLEWTLVGSKGSIERAKERLDRYCTAKVLHKKLFAEMDLKVVLPVLRDTFNLMVLPKFNDNLYRIIVCKYIKVPEISETAMNLFRMAIALLEYLRTHDYLNGVILIVDYNDVNVLDILKVMGVADLRQFVAVCMDGYGMRVKSIHAITSSTAFEVFLSIVKQALSAKLGQRINVHKKYESLYDFIPKDILPCDYGGKEKSLKELNDKWHKKIFSQEHKDHMKKMQERKNHSGSWSILITITWALPAASGGSSWTKSFFDQCFNLRVDLVLFDTKHNFQKEFVKILGIY